MKKKSSSLFADQLKKNIKKTILFFILCTATLVFTYSVNLIYSDFNRQHTQMFSQLQQQIKRVSNYGEFLQIQPILHEATFSISNAYPVYLSLVMLEEKKTLAYSGDESAQLHYFKKKSETFFDIPVHNKVKFIMITGLDFLIIKISLYFIFIVALMVSLALYTLRRIDKAISENSVGIDELEAAIKNETKINPSSKSFEKAAEIIRTHTSMRLQVDIIENISKVSRQVAHDIRSPLSVLNMITASLNGVDKGQKELIQSSIQRINDIANDLLKKGKLYAADNASDGSTFDNLDVILINTLIDGIISEKRHQFITKPALCIPPYYTQYFGLFIRIRPSDINRVLSNLINNSVEAIGDIPGSVEISLTSDDHNAIIKISDTGPGIPPHILAKLGEESISYGKENTDSGSGIGVLHAKKTIENMNGKFSISSTLGKGTTVTIALPLSEKPVWFLEKLYLKPNSTVLVCDDDASIIALWKKRFSEYDKVNINYFSSLNVLKEFLDNTQNTDFTLLTDYEFTGEKQTGLDFIIENNLASKSILVTSHYDEPDVIQKCIDHNIKQIPKNICALVPIEMASSKEYYDAVVLDNEDLQVRSWQFAAIQKGKNILTFSNSDEFLSALSNIDYQTPVFIDSILDRDVKGEDIAKKINDLGFKNIYMSSGHDPSHFSDMTFLKGVIGKSPFFP